MYVCILQYFPKKIINRKQMFMTDIICSKAIYITNSVCNTIWKIKQLISEAHQFSYTVTIQFT